MSESTSCMNLNQVDDVHLEQLLMNQHGWWQLSRHLGKCVLWTMLTVRHQSKCVPVRTILVVTAQAVGMNFNQHSKQIYNLNFYCKEWGLYIAEGSRLQVTFCPIIFMKNIIFLFSVQNPGMLAYNLTAKKVSLACNSCAGWVGGAGNWYQCLRLTVCVQSTTADFGVSYFLLEKHLTIYYTAFGFYEDRHWVAWKVFAEMTYRFCYTPRFSCLVSWKPPGFRIETRVICFPWHTATKLLRAALK